MYDCVRLATRLLREPARAPGESEAELVMALSHSVSERRYCGMTAWHRNARQVSSNTWALEKAFVLYQRTLPS